MKQKNSFRSIQKSLLFNIRGALLSLATVLFIMILSSAAILTQNTLEITMKQMAMNSAENLSTQMSLFKVVMKEVANSPVFDDMEGNKEDIIQILQDKRAEYWCFASFADSSGIDYITGGDVSTQPFFQRAMAGETYISSPYLSVEGDSIVYVIASPAYHDGKLVGVMYMMPDYDYLYGLITAHSVGGTGHTYVINRNDEVIMDIDMFTAISTSASQFNNKTTSHLDFESLAMSGAGEDGVGFGNFFEGGTMRVGGLCPCAWHRRLGAGHYRRIL